jgi:MinD-like ATPase involved in chromosome partitioning or flagellar assembly
VFLCHSLLDFAVQVARDFRDTGVFDQAATARILGPHSDRARDQNRLAYPPQALADAPEQAASRPATWRRQAAPRGGAARSGFFRPKRRGHRPMSDADLARQLAGRGPTIVVMGSRKGGVGKTSFAAGIAVVAGTVLDQIGHSACLVDANLANPDAWGQMNLPTGAATVREVVGALLANREPPPPVHAATPALACYPEVREPSEYSRTEIRRFADHLRRRHTFIVVDMSNRLPDPTGGAEAAAAAYWLDAGDVLVLPTTASRSDFDGVLDYLDVGGLPPTVVPYIVGTSKRLRDNPLTLEYVDAIRSRVAAIVEVPDDANAVRLAGMSGVPAEQLSPNLGAAYRALTEAIAVTPRRGGSRR